MNSISRQLARSSAAAFSAWVLITLAAISHNDLSVWMVAFGDGSAALRPIISIHAVPAAIIARLLARTRTARLSTRSVLDS